MDAVQLLHLNRENRGMRALCSPGPARRVLEASAPLDDDDRDLVRRPVDSVGRVLQVPVDLPGLQDLVHLRLAVEELADRLVIQAVDPVLRALGPNGMLRRNARKLDSGVLSDEADRFVLWLTELGDLQLAARKQNRRKRRPRVTIMEPPSR